MSLKQHKNRSKGRRYLWLLLLLPLAGITGALLLMPGCATAAYRPSKQLHQEPRTVTMTVTAYCNCGTCCGWHYTWYGRRVYSGGSNRGQPKKIGVTASGTHARIGTVADDTRYYPFRTVVYVPGYGYGRVEDRGGAIKGEKLDIWFPSHKRALQWGRQKVPVQVWLPKPQASRAAK